MPPHTCGSISQILNALPVEEGDPVLYDGEAAFRDDGLGVELHALDLRVPVCKAWYHTEVFD